MTKTFLQIYPILSFNIKISVEKSFEIGRKVYWHTNRRKEFLSTTLGNQIKIIAVIGQRGVIQKLNYKEALTTAKYKHKIRYQQNKKSNTTTTKNRERNIIWFNPPYSANVATSWKFLSFIEKHLSSQKNFNEIFNRNTVKISCNWLSSIKSNY